jgi:hypothetical protein
VEDYKAATEVTWINAAAAGQEASRSGYVNYHRFWVPPTWTAQTATISSSDPKQPTTTQTVTTTPITITHNTDKQTWNEVGILIKVPAGTTTTLYLEFTKPSIQDSPPNLTIFKQSGLPASPITLETPTKTTSWVQDSDVTVPLLQ